VGAALRPDPAPAHALADEIDRELTAAWQADGVAPAPAADEAEFLRRVYLDLVGKIPPVAEVRSFLADEHPDKRQRLVDDLLSSAVCAAHFANTWRDVLLAGTNPERRTNVPELETWLRLRFSANTPYDQLVAELVGGTIAAPVGRAQSRRTLVPSPLAYFQANERKPENLSASLSSVFLGVQVECAQCHDHPFAKWRQDDFWSFAAFFRGLDGASSEVMPVALADSFDRAGLTIPGTETVAVPRYLDGGIPAWNNEVGNRAMLAQWMTSPRNPFFARAAVNRVWEHFFGRPLADVTDPREPAQGSALAVLRDELAARFVASRFDLKLLIRGITASRAYQLSSRSRAAEPADAGDQDITVFARFPVRRMTADQLFDSLVQATGFHEAPPERGDQPFPVDSARADFRKKFGEQGRERVDSQTSIVQALTLMNGRLIGDAIDLERSKSLQAAVRSPFLDLPGRLEILFLATLSRPPRPEEAARFLAFIQRGEIDLGLADTFWVLLNSAEFISNH